MKSTDLLKVAVVEDDQWYREFLKYTLSLDPDLDVVTFESGKSFIESKCVPDVMTLDYSLPDLTGAELLQKVVKAFPDCEVIIVSEQEKVETAVALLQSGAYDYHVKGEDLRDKLLNSVRHIKQGKGLKKKIITLEQEANQSQDFRKKILGTSPAMQQVFDLIDKAKNNNLTVTVTGETGTGKEEVAKAIHSHSGFNKGPFVAINIAAVPKELAESELFGHEKGAFTGASSPRIGKFEEAAGGTLFLDEIGDLEPALQVKLLRVLQEKVFFRIGSNKPISFNARVVVATNKNLNEEVRQGAFREDLFYRIFGLTIALPPLRERGMDIMVLANYFITRFCKENNLGEKQLTEDAKDKLMNYRFPGNVRELKSLVELACVLSGEEQISADHIQLPFSANTADFFDDGLTMDQYTRKIIRHYLDRNDNNVISVAAKLGIGKSTIYRMMKDGVGV